MYTQSIKIRKFTCCNIEKRGVSNIRFYSVTQHISCECSRKLPKLPVHGDFHRLYYHSSQFRWGSIWALFSHKWFSLQKKWYTM
jgi:hypothetical protein